MYWHWIVKTMIWFMTRMITQQKSFYQKRLTKPSWTIALRQRHMTIMASRITGQSSVCSSVCSDWQQRNIKSLCYMYMPFVRGIRRWPEDSPPKVPVTHKKCSFDDVTMRTWISSCIHLKLHDIHVISNLYLNFKLKLRDGWIMISHRKLFR